MGNVNFLSTDAVGCFSDDEYDFPGCGSITDAESESPEEDEIIVNEDIEEIVMMRMKYDEYTIDLSTILEEYSKRREGGEGGDNSTLATLATVATFETIEETVRQNVEMEEQREKPTPLLEEESSCERLLKERLNHMRLDLEISRYESLLKEKAKQIQILEEKLGKVPSILSVERRM